MTLIHQVARLQILNAERHNMSVSQFLLEAYSSAAETMPEDDSLVGIDKTLEEDAAMQHSVSSRILFCQP